MKENECQRIVTLEIGMPQLKCGAPVPRKMCPFLHDRFNKCPYRGDNADS